jgi:hypothetical protein
MALDSAKTETEVRTPEPAVPRPLRRGQAELFASPPPSSSFASWLYECNPSATCAQSGV